MSGGKGQTHEYQLVSQNQHTLLSPTEAEWLWHCGGAGRWSHGGSGRSKNRWPPPARHQRQRFENILKPLSPQRDSGQEANVDETTLRTEGENMVDRGKYEDRKRGNDEDLEKNHEEYRIKNTEQ